MPHKSYRSTIVLIFIVVAVVAGALLAWRYHESSALKDATKKDAVPLVSVIAAAKGPGVEEVVLPGNVQAWHEAAIYARTNGYLKDWKTDIGTPVKEGDLIAEIDTPEVDAQLHQAQADLATARANAQLAQSTAARWKALLKTDSVSKQEADEKIGAAAAETAALISAQANVDRLKDLASFKRVVAPFDGIITARNTDNGALIANSNGTMELFHIADTSRLRIYVQVPETEAAAITPNMHAELHFAEHPGKSYTAQLLKTADAIDPASRTLLAQFVIENPHNELFAGGYTEVHLKLTSPANQLRLPVNTLIFRAQGLQVATVDDTHHIALKSVSMGRDFGNEVEILAGIQAGDKVVLNPPDSLSNGDKVRVKKPKDPNAPADKDKAGTTDKDKKSDGDTKSAKSNEKDVDADADDDDEDDTDADKKDKK